MEDKGTLEGFANFFAKINSSDLDQEEQIDIIYYRVSIFLDMNGRFDIELFVDGDGMEYIYDCLTTDYIKKLDVDCIARGVNHLIPDKTKIILVSSKELSEEEFKNLKN
ncbi:hypothetical protein [Virgibacillus sp. SK37]|uniref:hypothetical protein n=1 Tax=Virgibacillus sp. SK37 TaxID=403957 RepID=UPI0004D12B06|nr:hypothetical protein [Virgibacillus sp. SK37]AIF45659.1 hypothetical protein X953_18900 [Virgibacillus sp. SK37]